jgi:thioglycine synthase
LNSDAPILEEGHAALSQQAYRAVREWASCAGVTRIAEATGLDRLRLPNYYAVRPSARNRCAIVSSGRGSTREAALLSALFECFERWAAEEYSGQVTSASMNGLQREVPHLKVACPIGLLGDQELLWALGFDLISKEPCLLPLKNVIFPFPHMNIGAGAEIASTTNGLAAATQPLEAICSGVLELIERDAVSRLDPRHLILIDRTTLPQSAQELTRRFDQNAVELGVVRCPSPTGFPVYYAIAGDEPLELGFFFCSGSAAATNATDAVVRSLMEVSQSRVACISGLRDDVAIRIRAFAQTSYADRRKELDSWFSKTDLQPFPSEGEFSFRSFRQMLDALVDRISHGFVDPVLACAELRRAPGLAAFRLYCPQMDEPLPPTPPQL